MNDALDLPAQHGSWPRQRLTGELGSASDRDLDAHLLVCDGCFAKLVLGFLGVVTQAVEVVPA